VRFPAHYSPRGRDARPRFDRTVRRRFAEMMSTPPTAPSRTSGGFAQTGCLLPLTTPCGSPMKKTHRRKADITPQGISSTSTLLSRSTQFPFQIIRSLFLERVHPLCSRARSDLSTYAVHLMVTVTEQVPVAKPCGPETIIGPVPTETVPDWPARGPDVQVIALNVPVPHRNVDPL
jgi:hypothetical protein